jgi:D-sedoheptulose 7-phosphate isomerase
MNDRPTIAARTRDLIECLIRIDGNSPQIDRLGCELATRLLAGGRLLVAGNGGSAAHAQHLAAELVGRFELDRQPLSALALSESSCLGSALANDYGAEIVYARQVTAHGRPGDVLLCISTSGRSTNLLAAARAASDLELDVWSFTGSLPNPLASVSDRHIAVSASRATIIQEVHLVVLHMLCEAFERHVDRSRAVPVR